MRRISGKDNMEIKPSKQFEDYTGLQKTHKKAGGLHYRTIP
jgi:hypothetical protein